MVMAQTIKYQFSILSFIFRNLRTLPQQLNTVTQMHKVANFSLFMIHLHSEHWYAQIVGQIKILRFGFTYFTILALFN